MGSTAPRPWVVTALALAALLLTGAARAQPCRRDCAPAARDRYGCCPPRGPRPEAVRRALQRDERACDGGRLPACLAAGAAYAEGRPGVDRDAARAAALYARACDGRVWAACVRLGHAHRDGRGVRSDGARAIALYRAACDAGATAGCTGLGVMHTIGHGVARDLGG